MKKHIILGIVLLLVSIPCVMAQTGVLRIDPAWPVMVAPSYTFTVWSQSHDTYDVRVLLVVTQACYDGMPATGDAVTVNGVTALTKGDFTGVTLNSADVPPSATAPYEVAMLKDHLDYGLTVPLGAGDTIYWALSDVVFDPLTPTNASLPVTLDSTDPRMLVYLIGNSVDNSGALDVRVPPTLPGFIVPEIAIGSVMAVASMFTALGLYTYKKKHIPKQ